MIRRDMDEVLSINDEAYDRHWDEADFLAVLGQRNCIAMVVDDGERILGFMLYELHPHHLSLLRMAVRPSLHGCGIGSLMIERLTCKLSQERRESIWIEVGERDLEAQLFLRGRGFRHCQTFHPEHGDDVYLMKYRLGSRIRPEDSGWALQAFGGMA